MLRTLLRLSHHPVLSTATLTQTITLLASIQAKLTIMELADMLQCPKPRVCRSVDVLERAGLVKRVVNPGDRRQVFVVATPEGQAVVETALCHGRNTIKTEHL